MPFDSFTNRPGARSGSRRRPDPFGRLLADPGPDLDILDFNNPFRIRDSVGMEGLNGRRDVAKVESLLGRAGTLDLAKTDGVTGFFGARTDEAVKKFQKDRGLKVDGLITPNGPTLKTLIAQTGEYGPPKVLPTPRRPFNPTPGPPREAVRYAASRLLQLQKVGIDPRAQLLARQLAQAEPGAKTPDKPSSSPQGAGPGKGTSQDSGADLMDRLREIIDELKKNPDPQGGDIDTDEPEAKVEKSRKNPAKSDKPKRIKEIDDVVDRFRDLLESQLESDAKKELPKALTDEKERGKKAKQPPKQPDKPIRGSRPGGRGGGGAPLKMPNDPREPLNLFNFLQELLM